MEQTTNTDILLQFIPEVDDILDFQVTNQLILIKPTTVDVVKTAGGIIISGTGPDGNGGSIDLDKTKSLMPQRAVVVCCGARVDEVKPGMTVFYYKSALNEIMVRCGNDIYYGIQEYNIKGYLKP